MTPPNASPPDEGEEGPGPCDEYVNRHCDWQLLGWGGNVDCSPIVDHGSAHRYMVKYASKGEARSREAQRMLTRFVSAVTALGANDDTRMTLPQILRKVVMMCTTRRDMWVCRR